MIEISLKQCFLIERDGKSICGIFLFQYKLNTFDYFSKKLCNCEITPYKEHLLLLLNRNSENQVFEGKVPPDLPQVFHIPNVVPLPVGSHSTRAQ